MWRKGGGKNLPDPPHFHLTTDLSTVWETEFLAEIEKTAAVYRDSRLQKRLKLLNYFQTSDNLMEFGALCREFE